MSGALCAAVLVAGALSAGAAPSTQARLAAFHAEAVAQRARLGLEKDAARLEALYPAPEVHLPPGAEPAAACPGQTVEVKLEGRFLPGSLVVLQGEDAEVLEEALSPASWTARVRVLPTAPPRDVLVRVLSPVSETERAARLLDVGCQHRWVLALPGGETLTVRTTWPRGANTSVQATGEWTRGALTEPAALAVHASGAYTFERLPSPQETRARAALAASAPWRALQARAEEAQARVNACSRGPAGGQQACLKANGDALARVERERRALQDQALSGLQPRLGCETLKVSVAAGRLAGEAERCAAGPGRHPVTGTVGPP